MITHAVGTLFSVVRPHTAYPNYRIRVSRTLLPLALVLAAFVFPSQADAAYAVYAGSLTSPTQAQEEAQRINRALTITSATYERATVRGEVFWRVRVGIYRTQQEVNAIRQQFSNAGLGDTWMREVPDSELPEQSPSVQPQPTPTTRDTVSIDSVAASLVESISSLARRAVDSLETVSQRRLEHLLQRMQESFAEEVFRQVEEDRTQERSMYVT
ncbi:MAG TPA: SPOR domain-containing protein, partial [Firmicutes bacterium]|nr:SPOR domain-containing protein [Bacillota bacterium]